MHLITNQMIAGGLSSQPTDVHAEVAFKKAVKMGMIYLVPNHEGEAMAHQQKRGTTEWIKVL